MWYIEVNYHLGDFMCKYTKVLIYCGLFALVLLTISPDGCNKIEQPVAKAANAVGTQSKAAQTVTPADSATASITYPIVDTGQNLCFGEWDEIDPPSAGSPYYGQDAQNKGNQPSYKDNGDGTISDLVTGLMWVKARGEQFSWDDAVSGAAKCTVGGYNDWRMPTIKETYSLIDFNGMSRKTAEDSVPYINTKYFDFEYADTSIGRRLIDCQDWTSTEYVGKTMKGDAVVFGVNFADGRIKGYPKHKPGMPTEKYVRYVRGNPSYGINIFKDNQNGTITDKATGLMWTKSDSGSGLNWEKALAWVETKNSEKYLGYTDWRLPNAKELQSIVDYSRSPSTTNSAAIDPIFECTSIKDEGGKTNYPFYWSSTTHIENRFAVYVAFGEALGYMQFPKGTGPFQLMDVHGAGAQRSDPKDGDPADYPYGKGPQGDVIRIFNYIRLVRDAK